MNDGNNLHVRLLNAQCEIVKVSKSSTNPYFENKYADINSILETVKEPLNSNGLILTQAHDTNQFGDFVVTRISFNNEFVESRTKIVVAKQNDPQAYGSGITYARRYGLQSLLALQAEDDDGERAMSRNGKKKEPNYKDVIGKIPF